MSLPAINYESFYRNPITEVVKFFDEKHSNSYRIYNLCNERDYDPEYFHGNVVRYPIKDHNVPQLYMMLTFSRNATVYLKPNLNNIIAVHCKGGKGRTGCMICSYLLYSGVCVNAQEAFELYSSRRTDGTKVNQGITGPSQKRFVIYFEKLLDGIFINIIELYDIFNINEEPEKITHISNKELKNIFSTKFNKPVFLNTIEIRYVYFLYI